MALASSLFNSGSEGEKLNCLVFLYKDATTVSEIENVSVKAFYGSAVSVKPKFCNESKPTWVIRWI